MSDRELLEAAAKAAGIHWDPAAEAWYFPPATFRKDWNPLTDDGDALRLAVKLGIDIDFDFDLATDKPELVEAYRKTPSGEHYCPDEPYEPDPYAATRRCIVRAAAAIKGEQSER
jgi:hypothetical protein